MVDDFSEYEKHPVSERPRNREERNLEEASVGGMLVDYMFNTPPNKYLEMTNLPLDQIHNVSMISTYMQEVRQLCVMIKEAQLEYNRLRLDNAMQWRENDELWKQYYEEWQAYRKWRSKHPKEKPDRKKRIWSLFYEHERYWAKCFEAWEEYHDIWEERHQSMVTEVVDVDTDPDFDTTQLTLLADEWLFFFCQARRSRDGDAMKAATVLAQEEIVAESQKGMPMEVESWQ